MEKFSKAISFVYINFIVLRVSGLVHNNDKILNTEIQIYIKFYKIIVNTDLIF